MNLGETGENPLVQFKFLVKNTNLAPRQKGKNCMEIEEKITESCQNERGNCLKEEKVLILNLEVDTTITWRKVRVLIFSGWRAKPGEEKQKIQHDGGQTQ